MLGAVACKESEIVAEFMNFIFFANKSLQRHSGNDCGSPLDYRFNHRYLFVEKKPTRQ